MSICLYACVCVRVLLIGYQPYENPITLVK